MSKWMMYVGTYAAEHDADIYMYEYDEAMGVPKLAGTVSGVENPSYLCVDKETRFLYSVSETERFQGKNGGAVASFSIHPGTGQLALLQMQPTHGKHPCHLSLSAEGTRLFAANYSEGTLTSFPVLHDGSIDAASTVIAHQGSGPDPERQEGPHMHFAGLTPDARHLCAVDLGTDQVAVYELDAHTQDVQNSPKYRIGMKPGSGPRHLAFHPNGRYVYVIHELSSEITVFEYSPEGTSWKQLQLISTLPAHFAGFNTTAAIHFSPDGGYLYASNRGHDSLAVFRVAKETGLLTLAGHTSSGGRQPREFAFDPAGRYLFAANQGSGNVAAFSIHPETGIPIQTGCSLSIPNPACILFCKLTGDV